MALETYSHRAASFQWGSPALNAYPEAVGGTNWIPAISRAMAFRGYPPSQTPGVTGSIAYTLIPTAAALDYQIHPSITGDITFTVTLNATMDFTRHAGFVGDITFTLDPTAAGLVYAHNITGDITFTMSLAAAFGHHLQGDITFTLDPTATLLQFGYSIVGDIGYTLALNAAFGHHLQGSVPWTMSLAAAFGHHLQGDTTFTLTLNATLRKSIHAHIQGIQIDTFTPAATMDFRQGASLVGDIPLTLVGNATMVAHLSEEIHPYIRRLTSFHFGLPFITGLPEADGVLDVIDCALAFGAYEINETQVAIVGDVDFLLVPTAAMLYTSTKWPRPIIMRDARTKFTSTHLRM